MRSTHIRRYRHRTMPAKSENDFFKKEGQKTFFGEHSNKSFFQLPVIASPQSIQRKCDECEKEDKKVHNSNGILEKQL